jgi:hypothetical protein
MIKKNSTQKRQRVTNSLAERAKVEVVQAVPKPKAHKLFLTAMEIGWLLDMSNRAESIGESPLTNYRKKKLRQLANDTQIGLVEAKLLPNELRLLVAHWSWALFNGGMEEEAQRELFLLKECVGAQVINTIKGKIREYEIIQGEMDDQSIEDNFDFPEEDYDAYYCR